MKYRVGDWIIENAYGLKGTVSNVWDNGVTAKFGEMTAMRKFEHIQLAPLVLQQDDIETMIELALATKDEDWFRELTSRMGVDVNG